MLQEQPQDVTDPASGPDSVAPDAAADPQWFRPPSRRERWMAAGLFAGFGVFFVLLFFVTAGFWFRWVTLGLGLYSILYGLRYARGAAADVRQ
jgi:hypothetical protein